MEEMTESNLPENEIATADLSEDLSIDAIEEAYRQALEASESVESVEEFLDEADSNGREETDSENNELEQSIETLEQDSEDLKQAESETHVSEKDVVEVLLFVGAESLTSKKIAGLLSQNTKPESVERLIAQLNLEYEEQKRPYRIELHEGGYQMSLIPEQERIRERVFGMAPKEVRLSQEAVEILSIVAYRQPVSREEVDRISDKNAGTLLNQLLRRKLIVIDSKGKSKKDITYVTTDRFLQLFGLGQLSELPQADELDMK